MRSLSLFPLHRLANEARKDLGTRPSAPGSWVVPAGRWDSVFQTEGGLGTRCLDCLRFKGQGGGAAGLS